jgi:hypothetical protein
MATKQHARQAAPRMSKLGREAVRLFDEAVQRQYAILARKKIPTVVVVNGEKIKAVPRRVGNRYVVGPTPSDE